MNQRLSLALRFAYLTAAISLIVACQKYEACVPSQVGVYREAAGVLHPSTETFSRNLWRLQPGSALGNGLPLESAITDCSSAELLCLNRTMDGAVFAVPRQRSISLRRFTVAGATITYRGCFAVSGADCAIEEYVVAWGNEARDSAALALRPASEGIASDGDHKSRYIVRYDRNRGVTAYLELAQGQPLGPYSAAGAAAFDLASSSFFTLQGSRGILSCAASRSP